MKNNNFNKNNIIENHDDIDYEKEEQSQALEMRINTSEKLSKDHYEFLKNSGLEGISITDKSLEVVDSDFEEDLIINILKNPELVDSFDDIKDLDVNVIKAMVAEGSTEISSLDFDEDSAEIANSKLGNLNSSQLDDKEIEEKE
ncbi:hypothetical protein K9M50_00115 [Patescibacteria group bacterium]|nr:hypothetical protein [Patescibacteria group bacterium]